MEENTKRAYIYLVKIPASNDIYICASDNVLYPGTWVVCPTRYGMDMAIVIGSAANLGDDAEYTPGSTKICGACHFVPTQQQDDDLVAMGTIGDTPEFEFKATDEKPVFSEPECNEEGCWDTAYREPELVEIEGDIDWISHIATPDEIKRYHENLVEEQKAISVCKEKILKHGLNMKLVTAHFLLCEPKALFFFTSEDRVDFRELVKDLVSVFKMRIELRQIGVRDEARFLGGLGVCGRDLCCHCVSSKFDPVTIKMAKEQNLSLNSMKISGPCGRLLCCLSYEYNYYMNEKNNYPEEGTKLKIGSEFFKVTDVNIITGMISAEGSEGRIIIIPKKEIYFSQSESRWEITKEFQSEFLCD